MSKKSPTVQFRAQLPRDLDFLIRAIAPLKNSGKDWTISDVVIDALRDWFLKPENRELIERHRLLEALERAELTTTLFDAAPLDSDQPS